MDAQEWEYLGIYCSICGYLAIAAKDPKSICERLTNTYKYKLKGVGPIEVH